MKHGSSAEFWPSRSSDMFLQLPCEQSKNVKVSVGLVLSVPQSLQTLFLEAHTFMEELIQRIRIQVSKLIRHGKNAFIHYMYSLYCRTYETMLIYMTTKRLHLSAWHMTSHHTYLAQQFISLRKLLDTRERKFFLW